MKTVFLTLFVLCGAFCVACVVEIPPLGPVVEPSAGSHELQDGWRRTVDGWEQISEWTASAPDRPSGVASALHPLLIAGLQGLISCGALLWFDAHTGRQGKTGRSACTKRAAKRH